MRIVIFDIDSLRPDHLGCYGYPRPTSPAIDRIAAEGMRFDGYYCSDSPCLPSRMAWLSGRFGIHTGCVSNVGVGRDFDIRRRPYGGPMPEQETLMRQLRRQAGLEGIAITNFADRHCAQWFMHGWTEFISPSNKCGSETAEEVNAAVLNWLDRNRGRDDYVLHINYWDAHRVYRMDPSWAERFEGTPCPDWPDEAAIERMADYHGPFTARGQFKDGRSTVDLMPGEVTTREQYELMITGYDAAIAYVDHHLQQVLDALDEQDVLDEAVIIITGDHGDAFGEHGIYSDHVCADECIHRIPLIVRWPGVTTPGSACDGLLYHTDFAPTLCEMLDAPIPAQWDGRSFAPALRGEPFAGRQHLVWTHGLYATQRAVRTPQHLLIRTYDRWEYDHLRPVELYDMVADPYQTRDLTSVAQDTVTRLDHLLQDWLHEQLTAPGAIPDPLQALLHEQLHQGRSDRFRNS